MENDSKQINNKESYRVYEIGFHILPTLGEEKALEFFSNVRSFIENKGGVIISSETPKFKVLSYVMSKDIGGRKVRFKEAYFSWIKFECEASLAQELDKFAKNSEDILRYLIIKTIKGNTMTAPKIPVWKKKDSTEDSSSTVNDGQPSPSSVSEEELNKAIDLAIAE
jgi:ribosomal protein S6